MFEGSGCFLYHMNRKMEKVVILESRNGSRVTTSDIEYFSTFSQEFQKVSRNFQADYRFPRFLGPVDLGTLEWGLEDDPEFEYEKEKLKLSGVYHSCIIQI